MCLFFFDLGGPKLLQLQNLGGGSVVFFILGGQNRNFVKVRGRKLLLSLKKIYKLTSDLSVVTIKKLDIHCTQVKLK